MTPILNLNIAASDKAEIGKGRTFQIESLILRPIDNGYQLLDQGNLIHLKDGDILTLGEHQIIVHFKNNEQQEAEQSPVEQPIVDNYVNPLGLEESFPEHFQTQKQNETAQSILPESGHYSDSFNPLNFLDSSSLEAPQTSNQLFSGFQNELASSQHLSPQNYFSAPMPIDATDSTERLSYQREEDDGFSLQEPSNNLMPPEKAEAPAILNSPSNNSGDERLYQERNTTRNSTSSANSAEGNILATLGIEKNSESLTPVYMEKETSRHPVAIEKQSNPLAMMENFLEEESFFDQGSDDDFSSEKDSSIFNKVKRFTANFTHSEKL